jgi:hypothetical protein
LEISFKGNNISFTKELSKLDELALIFSERLSDTNIKHVVLSGYVAILFGRNRTSEDIDVICERTSFEPFSKFWKEITKDLECINAANLHSAYNEYLSEKKAIRFARKGEFIPNVEMKFETTEMHREAIRAPLIVEVNERRMPISSFEQQIAYKLFMNSEKDIEDARFLFKLFSDKLNMQKLNSYLEALKVPIPRAKRYLGWSD